MVGSRRDSLATAFVQSPRLHYGTAGDSSVCVNHVDHNAGGNYFSFVLRVSSSWNGTTFNGQIVLSDGRLVGLTEGTYSIRVWLDETNHWMRGTIHDEKRGATIHFQSGDRVFEFMRDLLIVPPHDGDGEPDQTDS